jgi:hypothetical protein
MDADLVTVRRRRDFSAVGASPHAKKEEQNRAIFGWKNSHSAGNSRKCAEAGPVGAGEADIVVEVAMAV